MFCTIEGKKRFSHFLSFDFIFSVNGKRRKNVWFWKEATAAAIQQITTFTLRAKANDFLSPFEELSVRSEFPCKKKEEEEITVHEFKWQNGKGKKAENRFQYDFKKRDTHKNAHAWKKVTHKIFNAADKKNVHEYYFFVGYSFLHHWREKKEIISLQNIEKERKKGNRSK